MKKRLELGDKVFRMEVVALVNKAANTVTGCGCDDVGTLIKWVEENI